MPAGVSKLTPPSELEESEESLDDSEDSEEVSSDKIASATALRSFRGDTDLVVCSEVLDDLVLSSSEVVSFSEEEEKL